ncbi:hypothetical protein [Mesorhizobium sp.]|nr:hypothetical protein [Mesorhizobium sp.]
MNIFAADTERNCDSKPLYVERVLSGFSPVSGSAENPIGETWFQQKAC